ncbi:hypothetical protein MTO96_028926 [Rhipicephalus appendiculatus]
MHYSSESGVHGGLRSVRLKHVPEYRPRLAGPQGAAERPVKLHPAIGGVFIRFQRQSSDSPVDAVVETASPIARAGSNYCTTGAAGAHGSLRCFMHREDDIVHRSKEARVIEFTLPLPRSRSGSVPVVFLGFSYVSVPDHSTRETPDVKRSREEASELARSV